MKEKDWKPWGDHPFIVAILVTTALFAAYTSWAQLQASTVQTKSQDLIDPTPSISPSPTTSPSTEPVTRLSPIYSNNNLITPKPLDIPVPTPTPTITLVPPVEALNESDRLLHERKCQQHLATFSNAKQNKDRDGILHYCEHSYISIEVCNQELVASSPTYAKVWQKLIAVDRSSGQRQTTIEDKNYTLILEGSEWKVDSQDWNKDVERISSANCSTL